jgi:hypothetical protein
MLYPNELVIHDGNAHQHKPHAPYVGPDGQPRAFGLVPRDYHANPLGCYGSIRPYHAVDFPLIPRSEWSQRARDQIAGGYRCSDLRMRGNNGQKIPSRDQNGRGYCWFHSGTSALLVARARANLAYADLSAYAGACVIKNFRDEGGWGAQGVDFLASRGVPTAKFWPQRSVDRACDNPATWENAKLYRVLEGWIDLAAAQYDRNLSFDQELSLYLVTQPCVKDENWWSHSICGVDAVDGSAQRDVTRGESGKLLQLKDFDQFWGMDDEVTGGWGVRIWNSWGDTWSSDGMGVLTGKQAVSDGCVGVLTTTASAA